MQEELRTEKEKYLQIQQDVKSTQTERVGQEESIAPSHDNSSIKYQDVELLHGILSSLHEDYSSSLEKAASAAQTNDTVDVSSLRAVINKRLGEEWSVLVLENAKMKLELDNIRSRINKEKRCFASELTTLQVDGANEKNFQVDEGNVLTDESTFPKDELSTHGSDQEVVEIMVYDQNKVIAKLEMDKLEVMKGLQRYKVDSNKNDDLDAKIESVSQRHNEDSQPVNDNLGTIVREKLHDLTTVQQENESLQRELDLVNGKYSSLESSYEDSNKAKEILEEKLQNLVERERTLCAEIVQMNERCSKLDEHLLLSTTENNKLKEDLHKLKSKMCAAQQERDAIKEQKIALEESLRQERDNTERELALEREQKSICENKLQEKTRQCEEERNLLQLKENCLSKVEKELAETKESYKKLQECVSEYEAEKGNMMKEINSLRCLQGLPTINRALRNREEVISKQGSLQSNSGDKRVQSRKNNKLNSELTRAKEQLVRLKAELTLSNMQTRNLGTQLSSLREDSTKLEAELSTVRLSPKNSRQRRNSFSYYEETVGLELELGEAKERIIDLQEKLLIIYKEKFALEEKIMGLEGQAKKETEESNDENNMAKELENNAEKPDAIQNPLKHEQNQGINLEQIKVFENKIDFLEAEKAQLKRDLENTNADKSRLEGIEFCVQQLVSLEEEQLRLKNRLKMWAQNAGDEQHISEAHQDCTISPRKTDSNKTIDNIFLSELKDLSEENVALQEEADSLKETITELESDLATLKLKVSMKDSIRETTLDKKAVAALLVSVKQERADLQTALDGALTEKDDLEEELAETKLKYTRLQREFAMMCMIKDELELEAISLRKANLSHGLSELSQSSEECRNEMSDSSTEDLIFYGDGSVEVSSKEKKSFVSAEKEDSSVGEGRTMIQNKSMNASSKAKTVSIVNAFCFSYKTV